VLIFYVKGVLLFSHIKKVFFFFLLALFCVGCQHGKNAREQFHSWLEENGKIKVLCTTVFVGELVRAVGGDEVDVLVLIPPRSDPHSYQLVKGDDEKFRRSDIIFSSGLGLEHRGALARYLSEKRAFALTGELEKDEIIMHGKIKDPHVWLDLSLWAKGVDVIVKTLVEKRKEERDNFLKRGEKLKESLRSQHKKIRSLLQRVPEKRRYLVTTHNAFHYFTRAYLATQEERDSGKWNHRCIAPEGLSPEGQINTRDLNAVVEYVLDHKTRAVFAEFGMSRDSIEKVVDAARSRGHNVTIAKKELYSDSVESSAEIIYQSIVERNARVIVEALIEGDIE